MSNPAGGTDYGQPLRFGVALPAARSGELAALGQAVEEAGLEVVLTLPAEDGRHDGLDPWTAAAWLSGATTTATVLATADLGGVRPPSVVGRAAASLDLLAGARTELVLPADQDPEALARAIVAVRAIWGDGPAPAHPLPVWIAGSGPDAAGVAGRLADGWLERSDDTECRRLAAKAVDSTARDAGRDPREVRRAVLVEPGTPAADLAGLVVEEGYSTLLLATTDAGLVARWARDVVPLAQQGASHARAARGTTVGIARPAAVRTRRLPGIAYDELPPGLAATAVEPGDLQYEDVRSTYVRGGAPGLVLRPRAPEQVAEALGFARRQPVDLGIRSGGHGMSGRSTNHGGIVIDVGALDTVEVLDERTRRVRVGAGARWGDVAAALRPHGLAISSGDYGGVGVGGLATAGGIGFLVREHGLTIDHLRAVELVLADGRRVRTDAETEPDLFWAVRGAGANFGIATAFEFEARPVSDVGFAQLVLDGTDTAALLEGYGEVLAAAPRDLTAFLILGPPRSGQPPVAQVMAVVDSPDPAVIVDRLEPLAAIAPLLQQQVVRTPYAGVIGRPDGGPHHGEGEPVVRSAYVDAITPEFARDAEAFLRSGATYFFQFRSLGGAVTDVSADATAFAHRDAAFSVLATGSSRARLDPAWDALAGHFDGLYLSFETDPRPERLHDAFPEPTLARLRELKRRYDPDCVFRDNFPIPPA